MAKMLNDEAEFLPGELDVLNRDALDSFHIDVFHFDAVWKRPNEARMEVLWAASIR